MIRKTILAIAVTAIIGVASLTPAAARPHGSGCGGLGLVGAAIAASSYHAVDESCYRYQTLVTPRGHLRRILVNVCN